MRGRGLPPELRLYAHGQGYDMVERPLIRDDETMPLEAGMCLAVHPGYETESLQRQRAAEEETGHRLRLEIETLKSPRRIEALAIDQLHLVSPSRDEAFVIQRVQPAEPPAKSVVARR